MKPLPLLPTNREAGINEAGCDEAGRGCLAGPVVAAAVILPDGFTHPLLRDSKKLTEAQRREARAVIETNAVAWAIGQCSPLEIDQINILNASIRAMHRALRGLGIRPGAIVVDGNRFKPFDDVPCTTVVKGDNTYANIAAASIMAKTERDSIMEQLSRDHPQYQWDQNKGYPTAAHRAAIAACGLTEHHRRSFRAL